MKEEDDSRYFNELSALVSHSIMSRIQLWCPYENINQTPPTLIKWLS